MPSGLRYWDSNAFLGWLNNEKGKAEKCEGVLNAAEEGKVEIVTSAWTLTEAIKRANLIGSPRLTPQATSQPPRAPRSALRRIAPAPRSCARRLLPGPG